MKMNFTKMFKNLSKWAVKHQPELMHAMGFAAGASALVLTATGTVKAVREIDEKELVKPLTKKEKVTTAAKYYIPAVAAAGASVAFHTIGIKTYINRNAMLASWGTMVYDKLNKLEDKNVEMLGEKKADKIKDSIASDAIKNADVTRVKETGHGNCLFIDSLNGQMIRSSAQYINDLINRFNRGIVNQMALERGEKVPHGEECRYPSLYNWELEMGEDETAFSTQMGWYHGQLIHAHIRYDKHEESGEPIGYIEFPAASMPRENPNRIFTYGYS